MDIYTFKSLIIKSKLTLKNKSIIFISMLIIILTLQFCTNSGSNINDAQKIETVKYNIFEQNQETCIKDFILGHWLFSGEDGSVSSEKVFNTFQIEFYILNDSLKFKCNLNTVQGGMVDVDKDIYISPDLYSDTTEGNVLITNNNGRIDLVLNEINSSFFKKIFIQIPANYKDYTSNANTGTLWDYLNLSTKYEKMILAKEGNKFNYNKRGSFIFISMSVNSRWSQDYSKISYYRYVEDIYKFTHPHLSIESNYELGNGYKIFIPNTTIYNKKLDYSGLSKILIQQMKENNEIEENDQIKPNGEEENQ